MQITIQAANTAGTGTFAYPLITDKDAVSEFACEPTEEIEVVRHARSAYAKIFDRGGALNRIAFRCVKQMGSVSLAENTVLNIMTIIPRVQAVTFTTTLPTRIVCSMAIARISRKRCRYMGCAVYYDFEFIGGELKKATSNA